MVVYYRQTTFQQRIYLFELVERLENVSEACRRVKVSHSTYYRWKPRYEKESVDGLREPRSHAVHNPHTIDPEIERRIIELRREHPDWGKKSTLIIVVTQLKHLVNGCRVKIEVNSYHSCYSTITIIILLCMHPFLVL